MGIYRKKPILIEAHQWYPQPGPTADKPRTKELYGVRYCPPARVNSAARGISFDQPGRYVIDTQHGPADVQPGDWIVTGINQEKYPVRPDIFAATYEPPTAPYADADEPLGKWERFIAWLTA